MNLPGILGHEKTVKKAVTSLRRQISLHIRWDVRCGLPITCVSTYIPAEIQRLRIQPPNSLYYNYTLVDTHVATIPPLW